MRKKTVKLKHYSVRRASSPDSVADFNAKLEELEEFKRLNEALKAMCSEKPDRLDDNEVSTTMLGEARQKKNDNQSMLTLKMVVIRLFAKSITSVHFVNPFGIEELSNFQIYKYQVRDYERSQTPIPQDVVERDDLRREGGEGSFLDNYQSSDVFCLLAELVCYYFKGAFRDFSNEPMDRKLSDRLAILTKSFENEIRHDDAAEMKLMAWLLAQNDEKIQVDISDHNAIKNSYLTLIRSKITPVDVDGHAEGGDHVELDSDQFTDFLKSLEKTISRRTGISESEVDPDLGYYFTAAKAFAAEEQKKKDFQDIASAAADRFDELLNDSMAELLKRYEDNQDNQGKQDKHDRLKTEIQRLKKEVRNFLVGVKSQKSATENLPSQANEFIDSLLNDEEKYPVLAKPACKSFAKSILMLVIKCFSFGLGSRGAWWGARRRSNEVLQRNLKENSLFKAEATSKEQSSAGFRPRL